MYPAAPSLVSYGRSLENDEGFPVLPERETQYIAGFMQVKHYI
jgi:hypothetical protein